MLTNIVWQTDRMLLDDLVFRLEQPDTQQPLELGKDYFIFYKGSWTVRQYEQFWARRPEFVAKNVLEFGMWDGGSTAFWFEWLRPQKMVGVDLYDRKDSPYFRRYCATRGLGDRLKTYWKTDQGDKDKLLQIYRQEFDGPLDVVLDDASHMYGSTRASFETLFPLLRPGGLYFIEDWAWAYWPAFHIPYYPLETELNRLTYECVDVAGSSQNYFTNPHVDDPLIESVTVYPHFTVVERGSLSAAEVGPLNLDTRICRRPGSKVTREDLAARDEEIKALHTQLNDKGKELKALQVRLQGEEVKARRLQIALRAERLQPLRQAAADREALRASFRQAAADREALLASLH